MPCDITTLQGMRRIVVDDVVLALPDAIAVHIDTRDARCTWSDDDKHDPDALLSLVGEVVRVVASKRKRYAVVSCDGIMACLPRASKLSVGRAVAIHLRANAARNIRE